MPRRRGTDETTVVFDVSYDADAGGAGREELAGAADVGPPPRSGPRSGHRRRRALVVACAVAVAVAAGLGLAHGFGGDGPSVLGGTGGLRPLPEAPTSRWTHENAYPVAVRGSTVVVRDGSDRALLVGLDAATGVQRWRVDVGADAMCGTELAGPPEPADAPVVCVTKDEVVAYSPDGAEIGRTGVDEDAVSTTPGPPGTVVEVRRVGAPVGGTAGTPAGVDGVDLSAGRAAEVTVQDAVSREVRGTAVLPFDASDADSCAGVVFDADSAVPQDGREVDALWVTVVGDLVRVGGCGVQGALTADGVRVDDPDVRDEDVVQDARGGFLRTGETGPTPVVSMAPDGSVRWRSDGTVSVPEASDGVVDVTLVRAPGSVRALDARGRTRWTGDTLFAAVLAQVGTTGVVRLDDQVRGIDLDTGRELWTADLPPSAAADAYGAAPNLRVFTDGDRVVLWVGASTVVQDVSTGEMAVSGDLTAYDLDDGHVVWSVDDLDGQPTSIAGRLLLRDGATLTMLG